MVHGWAELLSRMKRLNGFSEVLRFLITSEKFSVYFSEVYNPTLPPHPMPPHMGWGWGCPYQNSLTMYLITTPIIRL